MARRAAAKVSAQPPASSKENQLLPNNRVSTGTKVKYGAAQSGNISNRGGSSTRTVRALVKRKGLTSAVASSSPRSDPAAPKKSAKAELFPASPPPASSPPAAAAAAAKAQQAVEATPASAPVPASTSASRCGGGSHGQNGHVLRSDTKDVRDMLQSRQLEVEFLLRPELSSSTALAAVRASVTSALAFDDELTALGAEHEMPKGRIFQALLEELRHAGADHAQTENTPTKTASQTASRSKYHEEFGAEKWAELAASADTLRNLVRIKVADDNDLKTARQGLILCRDFFDGLSQLGAQRGVDDEFVVFDELAKLSA